MGLFGGSKSKTSVSNVYDTDTVTTQTDNSGNEGFQNIGGNLSLASSESYSSSNTTVNQSIDAGALKTAESITKGSFGLVGAGLDNAQAASAGALAFGKSALEQVADANASSLDVLAGLVSGAFDNSKTIARDALAASAQATSDAAAGFGALAKQTSASTDDRVGKVAMYAFAALAAVFVLPALFKRGGKAVVA